ncbi:MAG: universal stress protein [Planctomycetota bacterium]
MSESPLSPTRASDAATRSTRRLLVGLDAAGSALEALSVAIDLAHRLQASIEMVHAVVPHRLGAALTEADLLAARRAVQLKLEASLPGSQLPFLAESRNLIVEAGHPAPVLLQHAAQPGTELLLLGGHRRRGLLDLRGTAHAVLARAACPVWVHVGEVRHVRHILVPVDLSAESLKALALACVWSENWGARITALHCFVPPELYYGHGYPVPGSTLVLERLRQEARAEFEAAMSAFAWGPVPHSVVFQEAFPASQILELQDRVDLIIMGTHGRTGLSGLILGSVASTVLREARVPVVTLRSADREWLL